MATQSSDKLDSSQPYQYLNFENNSNNCWLNCCLALIAHSKVLEKMIKSDKETCKIKEVISMYNEAISTLNEPNISIDSRVKTVRDKLHKIQSNVHHYLQPILKYEVGEPESAFCALLNLINENKNIKEQLSISWLWKKLCSKCGNKCSENVKPIITLSKVDNFAPECPTAIYMCSCKVERNMKLTYKEIPPCVFFHFEKGAGNQGLPPVIFFIQDREYQLTGVIILKKGKINHFIAWIRNPSENTWLKCNDLEKNLVAFSPEQPAFNPKDIYLYLFESFDNLGKIHNDISAEEICEQDSQAELICISDDESEDISSPLKNSEINSHTSEVSVTKCGANLFLQDSIAETSNTSDKFTDSARHSPRASDHSACAKSVGTSGLPDFSKVFIRNLRFSVPPMLRESRFQKPSINKDKIEEDSISFKIKSDASVFESKNKNVGKEDSLVDVDKVKSYIKPKASNTSNKLTENARHFHGASDRSAEHLIAVKTEGTSDVFDITKVYIRNLRFSKPLCLQNMEKDSLIEKAAEATPPQPAREKIKTKEDCDGFEPKTHALCSDSSESKNKKRV